ncbi:MAG: pentapeptide repeat-containing protein [Pseudomonadota bacterium]
MKQGDHIVSILRAAQTSRFLGRRFQTWFSLVLVLTIVGGPLSRGVAAADMSARDFAYKLKAVTEDAPLDVSDMDLSVLDLSSLDFKSAILTGVDLYGADLTGADLSYVDLRDTRIDRAVIIGTNFSYANLEGAELSLPTTSKNMSFNITESAKFLGANLTGARVLARLHGANFRKAVLRKTDFSALNPGTATIASVPRNYLIGAHFDGADAREADFSNANMNFATFTDADLRGADFTSAELVGADLTGAKLEGAIFEGADLRDVKGAELSIGQATSSGPPKRPGQ